MEIAELNRFLSILSEHELAYRAGDHSAWRNTNPLVTWNGRTVFQFNTDEEGAQNYWRDALKRPDAPPLDSKLWLRRNSRFRAVPEHVHANIEMSYVYSGACPQLVDGHNIRLANDQVLLLDSDCPHAIDALGERDIIISVLFSRDFLAQCLMDAGSSESYVSRFLVNALAKETDHRHYVLFRSERNRRIRRFFQELMCEFFDPSPNAQQMLPALFKLILMELVNVYEADYNRCQQGAQRVSVIPIIRYIEQNYLICTQESVAEQFFISPGYVNTLLKRHTGMTYIQMVQAQKLGCAANLLRQSDLPIDKVARTCGYENLSFFYRKFEARFGCKPGTYRKRHQAT